VRIALMYFRPPPNGWKSFSVESEGVTLETRPIGAAPPPDGRQRILVVAETRLDELPSRNAEGCVTVPEDQRRRLEALIETTAAVIAVSARCQHSISSAHPSAALVAESDDERKFLKDSAGLDAAPQSRSGITYEIDMSPEMVAGLTDRREGLGLLAEAFAHERSLARYREFMRFFELALALPSSALSKKLYQFLTGMPFGYSHAEVRSWCSLRHGSVHGDRKVTPDLVLEADVRPIVGRMEQAALDVLFNKQSWHDGSRLRRKLWSPIGGTTSPNGDLMIVKGTTPSITAQIFDRFFAYPLDLSGTITSPPQEWWHGPCTAEDTVPEERESAAT
jgi:hypothetical protein